MGRPLPEAPRAKAAVLLLLAGLLGCAAVQGPDSATPPPAPQSEAAPSAERAIGLFNQGRELAGRGDHAVEASGESNRSVSER